MKIKKKKIHKIFNLIKKKINSNIQIIIKLNKETNIKIKNQYLENIEFKKSKYIKIIIYKNYRKCIFTCNNLKKKNILNIINYINNTIKYISKDKYNKLPNKKLFHKHYEKNLGLSFNDDISIKEMIYICKNIEKNSLNINKKLISSDGVLFNKNESKIYIFNNYKKIKKYFFKNYLIINNIIAKNKKYMEYNYDYIYSHKLSDILSKYHFLSKKLVKNTIKKLNPRKINTKKSLVIFNNEISVEIFQYLIKSITGYYIYNKKSFMIKKLKKYILPKWISIIENPLIYKGIGTKPFDGEGLNTKKYYVVKKGILKTWILDSYSSKKLKIKNTHNYGGIHNWCFEKNKKNISYKKLIKKMYNGLIIDKLLGQGVNINTGIYSKGISGFWVENGKIKFPVNEVTISGNLKELFYNIIQMSDDVNTNSNIRTGSILVPNVQISGIKK